MREEALGMIETRGVVSAVAAADAALKAAPVRLQHRVRTGGSWITVIVRGEVAAVRAAVEAGAAAARAVGRLAGVHVIPRPSEPVEEVIGPRTGGLGRKRKGGGKGRGKGAPSSRGEQGEES
ncbi:MAG: BMC domain-containing protein [Deltaproteobacteria bacterium]|nr:BMC domain-containing protein [Deltaproteobacteria bacterium]